MRNCLRPFVVTTGLVDEKPEGWDDALSSKEFLSDMKKIMKKKFEQKKRK
jgi:hypothetical protein